MAKICFSKQNKNMHTQNIELIADTLSNIFDWDSKNLKSDFIKSLKENEIRVPFEIAEKIFDDFINLDVKTRNSPSFDYQQFISARYIS